MQKGGDKAPARKEEEKEKVQEDGATEREHKFLRSGYRNLGGFK